jgi:hypothetical protein
MIPFVALLLLSLAASALAHKSVVVLKLPRSGSSWFVSLLSQQAGVWVVPQLLKPEEDADAINDARDIELVASALHDGYKLPPEDAAKQTLVGFSLNPLKFANESRFNGGKALQTVVKKTDAFVVLFERTNLVKQALATMRGACLKQACQFNNVVINQDAWSKSHVLLNGVNSSKDFAGCSLPERHRVPLDEFKCTVVWHSVARDTLRRLQEQVARPERRVFVTYESLQRNLTGALGALFAEQALGPLTAELTTTPFFSKSTSENLKDAIINYGELFEEFESVRSACLLEMLQVDHARTFSTADCPMPKSWLKQCRAWIPQGKPHPPGFENACTLVAQ